MLVKGYKASITQNECVLGSHVQLGDYSEQYYIVYMKFAERLNLKCSQKHLSNPVKCSTG